MNNRTQFGFTLIEVMIALLLGIVIAGGVVGLFASGQRSFRQDQNIARMQDSARFAINELARDIRMAGYTGEVVNPIMIQHQAGLAVATDCGVAGQANWILNFTDDVTDEVNTLVSVDNATGATANASFSCITTAEVLGNTDVVGIKRFAGRSLPVASLQVNTIYMESNSAQGLMYQAPPGAPLAGSISHWEYRPHIYYIRNFTNVAGDGIPSLCRKALEFGAAVGIQTECIAEGIEDLQLEYGLDVDGDGSAERYLPDPTLTELQQVISARIFLLARTTREDHAYTDDRTYPISNRPIAAGANPGPQDQFHRRVYTVTVPIFNMRNRMLFGTIGV